MSRRLATLLLILGATLAHGADPAPASAGATTGDAGEPQARIEALRADGKRLRKEAEATYAANERLCYERFLVNKCIAEAKEQRLEMIRRARELEAEARALDLAERRRRAAERDLPPTSAAPAPAAPAAPASPAAASPLPSPSPDAGVEPNADAERIRAEREGELRAADPAARTAREAEDAGRAAARAKAEAEAAARAEEAARDRAKYEERLRRYEEEQANRKKGDK